VHADDAPNRAPAWLAITVQKYFPQATALPIVPGASKKCEVALAQSLCSQGAVMKRVLFWGTIVAGAVAAYMMYRRGEPMGTIAVRAVTNPVGSLYSELQEAAG
jgi:hypothetical protein